MFSSSGVAFRKCDLASFNFLCHHHQPDFSRPRGAETVLLHVLGQSTNHHERHIQLRSTYLTRYHQHNILSYLAILLPIRYPTHQTQIDRRHRSWVYSLARSPCFSVEFDQVSDQVLPLLITRTSTLSLFSLRARARAWWILLGALLGLHRNLRG